MKVSTALKLIDKGWVRKKKGFRVRYETPADGEWATAHVPTDAEPLLDSDVAAWRLAWKLHQAAMPDAGEPPEGGLFNIHVVDEEGNPVPFYSTNHPHFYNVRPVEP